MLRFGLIPSIARSISRVGLVPGAWLVLLAAIAIAGPAGAPFSVVEAQGTGQQPSPTPQPPRFTNTPTFAPQATSTPTPTFVISPTPQASPTRTPTRVVSPTPTATLPPGITPTATPTATPTCPPLTLDPSTPSSSLAVNVSGTNTTDKFGFVEVTSAGWPVVSTSGLITPGAPWSLVYTVPEAASIGTHPMRAYLRPSNPPPPDLRSPSIFARKWPPLPPDDPLNGILPGSSLDVFSPLHPIGAGFFSGLENESVHAGEPEGDFQTAQIPVAFQASPLGAHAALASLVNSRILIGCADLELPQGFAIFQGKVVDAESGAGVSGASVELIAAPLNLPLAKGPKSSVEYLALDLYVAAVLSVPSCAAGPAGSVGLNDFALSALAYGASRYDDLATRLQAPAFRVLSAAAGPPGLALPVELEDVAAALGPPRLAAVGSPGAFAAGILIFDPTAGDFSQSVPAPGAYYVKATRDGYIPYVGDAKYFAKRFQLVNVGDVPLTRYSDASAPTKNCGPSPYFLSFPDNQLPVEVHFVAWKPAEWEKDVASMDFRVGSGPIVPMHPLAGGGWGADYNVSPLAVGNQCVSARPTFADGTTGDFETNSASCPTKITMLATPGWVDSAWAADEQLRWNRGAWRYELSYKVPRFAFDYERNFGPYNLPIVDIEIIPLIENHFAMGITVDELFTPAQRGSATRGWWGDANEELALVIFNQNILNKLLAEIGLPPIGDLPINVNYRGAGGFANNEPWYNWSLGPGVIHVVPKSKILDVPDGTLAGVVTLHFKVYFGIDASMGFSGSIDPERDTGQLTATINPGITFLVEPRVDVELLIPVASVGAGAVVQTGLEIPITYRDLPNNLDVDVCFWLTANIYVTTNVWKFHDDPGWTIRPFSPLEVDAPNGCRFGELFPVYAIDEDSPSTAVGELVAQSAQAGPIEPISMAPALATDGAGNTLLLWSPAGETRSGSRNPAVLYQRLDGDARTRADFAGQFRTPDSEGGIDPVVAFTGPNQAIAAWTRVPNSRDAAEVKSRLQAALAEGRIEELPALFKEGLNTYEIAYVVWDGQRWLPSATLTNDNILDAAPALAADPSTGRALLAWVKDAGQGIAAREEAIYFAEWDGRGWSTPSSVYASGGRNYAPTVAYRDGKAVLIWVEDQDGDLMTTQDARLMMGVYRGGRWESIEPLPGVPGGASSPNVALDRTGNPLIAFTVLGPGTHFSAEPAPYAAYVRGAQVEVAALGEGSPGEEPRVVIMPDGTALVFFRPTGAVGDFPTLSGRPAPRGSGATVRRTPGFPDGLRASSSVAATGATLGEGPLSWGTPRIIASKEGANWAGFTVAPTDADAMYLVAADALTIPQLGNLEEGLSYLRMPYRPNPVVELLSFSDPTAGDGQQVAVQATVANLGFAPIEAGATVAFYLDDPADPARLIARVPLAPAPFSARQVVSATFTSDGQQHLVFAVASNAQDAGRLQGRSDASAVFRPLPVPANLRASANPIGAGVLLNWEAPASGDVAGFTVVRAESASGPYSSVGDATLPAYVDETASAGRAWYYRVAALNASGQGSLLSNVASTAPAEP